MKKDTKDRAWKREDGISCSPILDREFERKSRSRLCHGGWPLIHGFSPKSLAACSRGQWTRFHPGELLEKDCEAGRGRMQGRGDASSGNSARLKDACTGSKLTTSRFLNRIIFFFFFFYTRNDRIFFNHRTIIATFQFWKWFLSCILDVICFIGSVRVVRIFLKMKRNFVFHLNSKNQLSKEKWESFQRFEVLKKRFRLSG